MKKSFIIIGLVVALSAVSAMPAFAGWEQSGTIWKYNADGAYYNDGWHWIDGNNDGLSECYYFNADGTMLSNTTTPDNFIVNAEGQWIINGVVQTKVASQSTQPAPQPTQPAPVEQPAPQPEVTQPAPEPTQQVPDASTYTSPGKITFDDTPLSEDQHLSPEQEKAINDIQFN